MKITLLNILFAFVFFCAYCQNDSSKFQIGDKYGGGIIFFIDNTGEHGLIASPKNQTDYKVMWGKNGTTDALSLTDGQENAEKIVKYFSKNRRSLEQTAAYICDTLTLGSFEDWYLPAINELQKIYDNQNYIGKFWAGDYCSSTEYNATDACHIHFLPKKTRQFYYNKTDYNYYVRCIRKF